MYFICSQQLIFIFSGMSFSIQTYDLRLMWYLIFTKSYVDYNIAVIFWKCQGRNHQASAFSRKIVLDSESNQKPFSLWVWSISVSLSYCTYTRNLDPHLLKNKHRKALPPQRMPSKIINKPTTRKLYEITHFWNDSRILFFIII